MNALRRDAGAYEESCRRAAEDYAKKLHAGLSAQVSRANGIFHARWDAHWMNAENIYRDEFDTLKQMEISDQLRQLKAGSAFVRDILVICPERDRVITTAGWYSFSDYARYYAEKIQIIPAGGGRNSARRRVCQPAAPGYHRAPE